MKIQPFSNSKCSFGYSGSARKITLVKDIINDAIAPIREATLCERKALGNALGIKSFILEKWSPQHRVHAGDIIEGEILPNISVTTKGVSPIQIVKNVINVELARIRGQLKRVSPDSLNL